MKTENNKKPDEVLRDQPVSFKCLLSDLRELGMSIEMAAPGVRVTLPYYRAHRLERLLTEATIRVERTYWEEQGRQQRVEAKVEEPLPCNTCARYGACSIQADGAFPAECSKYTERKR